MIDNELAAARYVLPSVTVPFRLMVMVEFATIGVMVLTTTDKLPVVELGRDEDPYTSDTCDDGLVMFKYMYTLVVRKLGLKAREAYMK